MASKKKVIDGLTSGGKSNSLIGDPFGQKAVAAEANKMEADKLAAAQAAIGKSNQYTQQQVGRGRGDITQATGQAKDALSSYYGQARNDLQGSYGVADTMLNQGYDTARADIQAAPDRLGDLYGGGLGAGFEGDPGYQFRLRQGQQAIENAASARGGRHGGDTLKALSEYNQNFASNEFNNYANRQIGLAGAADQNSTNRAGTLAGLAVGEGQQGAGLVSQYGQNMANMNMGQGQTLGQLYANQGQQLAGIGMQGAGLVANNSQALAGGTLGQQTHVAPGPLGQVAPIAAQGLGAYFGAK